MNTENKNEIKGTIKLIEKNLLILVRKCIVDHIAINDSWNIYVNNGKLLIDEIERNISETHSMQVLRGFYFHDGYCFECKFEAKGRLGAIFEKFKLSKELVIKVEDDTGERNVSIYDENEARTTVRKVFHSQLRRKNWDLEKYEQLNSEISRASLLAILK